MQTHSPPGNTWQKLTPAARQTANWSSSCLRPP